MSSAVEMADRYIVATESPDKKTEKEYRRDAQRLFLALQKWESVSLKFGDDKVGWEEEVLRLTNLKQHFIARWGYDRLEEEQRQAYIRLALVKLSEPISPHVPREEKKEAGQTPEEKRRERRSSKTQLRRHFRLCY